jgi:hypothetical protein
MAVPQVVKEPRVKSRENARILNVKLKSLKKMMNWSKLRTFNTKIMKMMCS